MIALLKPLDFGWTNDSFFGYALLVTMILSIPLTYRIYRAVEFCLAEQHRITLADPWYFFVWKFKRSSSKLRIMVHVTAIGGCLLGVASCQPELNLPVSVALMRMLMFVAVFYLGMIVMTLCSVKIAASVPGFWYGIGLIVPLGGLITSLILFGFLPVLFFLVQLFEQWIPQSWLFFLFEFEYFGKGVDGRVRGEEIVFGYVILASGIYGLLALTLKRHLASKFNLSIQTRIKWL